MKVTKSKSNVISDLIGYLKMLVPWRYNLCGENRDARTSLARSADDRYRFKQVLVILVETIEFHGTNERPISQGRNPFRLRRRSWAEARSLWTISMNQRN